MKTNRISIHALPLLTWIIATVVYLYSQNNLYSCLFVFGLLFLMSKLYISLRWKDLLYSWTLVSLGLMLFYGLFLHEGNTVLFSIPGKLPLWSGIISLNSILYGFFLGGSLTLALFMFSLFSQFLKNQRPRFYFPGIWSNISILFSFLSYFVSFFLTHREEFQHKLKSRGLKLNRFQQLKLFLHDSSFHALESAFSFAETLEMRGFNRAYEKVGIYDLVSLISIFMMMFFLVFYRIRHELWMLGCVAICIVGFIWSMKHLKASSLVSQSYQYAFNRLDWVILIWSIVFMCVSMHHSFEFHSFLSKMEIKEYFRFHASIHGLFMVHVFSVIKLFPRKGAK